MKKETEKNKHVKEDIRRHTNEDELSQIVNKYETKIKEQEEIISSLLNEINTYKKSISFRALHPIHHSFKRFVQLISLSKNALENELDFFIKTINKSNLFNKHFYLKKYPEVANSGIEAAKHYLLYGGFEGRNPSKKFDSALYLSNNPDVKESGMNPLLHYILHGESEGRKIIGLHKAQPENNTNSFENVDTAQIENDKKVIKKSNLFDESFYFAHYPDVKNAGVDPVDHYLLHGWKEGRNPNSWFDTNYYISSNPEWNEKHTNPFIHYILKGSKTNSFTNVINEINQEQTQHSDEISTIPGKRSRVSSKPSILLCAHLVAKNIYGSERSFIDIAEGFSRIGYNLIITLPNASNLAYIKELQKHCSKLLIFKYNWWDKDIPININSVNIFKSLLIENSIDVIHVNTIMLKEPLLAAKELGIITVVHSREIISYDPDLCNSIGLSGNKIVSEIVSNTNYIIANSKATAHCFSIPNRTFIVPNAIKFEDFNIENNVNPDQITISLIGNTIPKKGIFDFFEIASLLQSKTPNALFQLIGPENEFTEAFRKRQNAGEFLNVNITGYMETPLDAISNTNIVLNLSHFRESFGRTVLEAMAAGRPVVAYNWGAIPELVEHEKNGFLVPYRDVNSAATCIQRLCNNVTLLMQMGNRGRIIAKKCFSTYSFAFNLHSAYQKILPKEKTTSSLSEHDSIGQSNVSVIIPNYNYEKFLPERINSILNQTLRPLEILFLDDNSFDNSLNVAQEILSKNSIPFRIFKNKKNKGTYHQWIKGIQEAKGEMIWIAEADDFSEPDFLENMIPELDNPVTVITYCQSKIIDENGEIICNNNLYHTHDLDNSRWINHYRSTGIREMADFLVYRNTIPNVSACLFKKEDLFDSLEGLENFRYCGDWFLYSNLLLKGNISYLAQSYNSFRRHSVSVTRSNFMSEDYLSELIIIKNFQVNNYPIHSSQIEVIKHYFNKDYRFDGLKINAEHPKFHEFQKNAIEITSERKRFAFVTTNHNSTNGGSEMLWTESVKHLRQQGHDIILIIKKWDPEPQLFHELRSRGIEILFKDNDEYEQLISFRPDLFIISTGDQDEGTEWFPFCIESNIPYCIINHLTKEIKYWPLRKDKLPLVKEGYKNAERVFFTCWNNHSIMQQRIDEEITNAEVFYNPYKVDRNISIPFPSFNSGIQIAMPHRLLLIHKGQDMVFRLLTKEKWRKRNIVLNIYGDGPDKEYLMEFAKNNKLNLIYFHSRVSDVRLIWEKNHAILFSSYMEGMPIILIEAMLCARVPIATNVGGHEEVITNNISGFIAQSPSIDDIDDALERAFQRINEWKVIGEKAREQVLNYLPEMEPVVHFCERLVSCASKEY